LSFGFRLVFLKSSGDIPKSPQHLPEDSEEEEEVISLYVVVSVCSQDPEDVVDTDLFSSCLSILFSPFF